MRMKLSTILRRAARIVEKGKEGASLGRYSCIAVTIAAAGVCVTQNRNTSPTAAYQELLLGKRGRLSVCHFEVGDASYAQARDHRVLALCMAATLADDPEFRI